MGRYRCTIAFRAEWKKSGYIMRSESRYMLDENMVLHETTFYRLNIRKLVLPVTIFSLVVLGGVGAVRGMSGAETAGVNKSELFYAKEHEEDVVEVIPLETDTKLFVERLSTEYLSEEDFYAAGETEGDLGESLQYFINYIYASNGHVFQEGGAADILFQEERWYQEIEEKKEVSYEDLNEYERQNCDVLVGILKREGYR